MRLAKLTDLEFDLQQKLILKYDKIQIRWSADLHVVIEFILMHYDFSQDKVVKAFEKGLGDKDNAIILATYLLNYENGL